jgi:hypothetical protein
MADCKGPVEGEPLDANDWYNKARTEQDHKQFEKPLSEQQIIGLRFNDAMQESI